MIIVDEVIGDSPSFVGIQSRAADEGGAAEKRESFLTKKLPNELINF